MRFCRAVRPLLADNRSCKAQKRVNVDNRASLERKLHYELYQLWTMLISTALLCEAGSYGATYFPSLEKCLDGDQLLM
jgi:hypothetical protein